jgi:hypothetical protein
VEQVWGRIEADSKTTVGNQTPTSKVSFAYLFMTLFQKTIHYIAIGSSILLFKLQYVIIYFDEWNFVYLGAEVMCKEMHIQ